MINQIIETGKLTFIAVVPVFLGTIVDANAATNTISASTNVPLGAVIATVSIFASGSWFLSSKFKFYENKLNGIQAALEEITKELQDKPCFKDSNLCKLQPKYNFQRKKR